MSNDNPSLELSPLAKNELARMNANPASHSADPVALMLQGMLDKGISGENVAAFEKLIGIYERMQEKDAEKQFAAAFSELQSEMPAVHATKIVPDKYGNAKFKFAPYEEIMDAVRPFLQKHGFTVTFSMAFSEGRITQTCTLQHIGGHSRSNQFACRIGSGPPGASESQADGAASTYAKRFALCNALNITVEMDNDARVEGANITADKAQYLREQVKETGVDEAAFLKYANAVDYEHISESRYSSLVQALEKKKSK